MKKLRPYQIGLAMAFLGFSIFVLALAGSTGQTASPVSKPGKPTVRITQSGFHPQELWVGKQEQVIFVNEDRFSHWPASDPHPLHHLLAGFDAGQALLPGASWEFRFEKSGPWSYHDHLHPHRRGKIIVQASQKSLKDLLSWGKIQNLFTQEEKKKPSSPLDFLPIENRVSLPKAEVARLMTISQNEGVAKAYEELEARWKGEPALAHDLAHFLGYLAYVADGFSGFAVCDNQFAFGCYHGFLEELLRVEGEGGIKQAEIGCRNLQLQGKIDSCIHGIGHGLMAWTGGKLAEALDYCRRIEEQKIKFCVDGAYMEFYSGVMFENQQKEVLSPAGPWQFCMHEPEFGRAECLRNQTIFLLRLSPDMLPRVVKACQELPKPLRESCVNSVGLFGGQVAKGKVEIVQQICEEFFEEENLVACFTAAAQEFIFQEQNVDAAKNLCQSLGEKSQNQAFCLEGISKIQEIYGL